MNKEYGLVSENNGSTVVAEYAGLKRKDTSYQSEAQERINTGKIKGMRINIRCFRKKWKRESDINKTRNK